MQVQTLEIGDVVQINPEHDECFGGSLMVVTEPKSWGAQGYIQIPGETRNERGQAYYRCEFANMEYVGRAIWWIE